MGTHCSHLESVKTLAPNGSGCEKCVAMRDSWVHLRLCLTCGHGGFCDDPQHRNATKHFRATRHPIITPLEPGENRSWYDVDDVLMEFT